MKIKKRAIILALILIYLSTVELVKFFDYITAILSPADWVVSSLLIISTLIALTLILNKNSNNSDPDPESDSDIVEKVNNILKYLHGRKHLDNLFETEIKKLKKKVK